MGRHRRKFDLHGAPENVEKSVVWQIHYLQMNVELEILRENLNRESYEFRIIEYSMLNNLNL